MLADGASLLVPRMTMVLKFFRRCLAVLAVVKLVAVLALALCGLLACAQPSFYNAETAAAQDHATAMLELERAYDSIQGFVMRGGAGGTLPVVLQERHLNALLSRECQDLDAHFQSPRISLDGDMLRLAATLATPAIDLVLSCDLRFAEMQGRDVEIELHALRVGRMPLPTATIVTALLEANPHLPQGIGLRVEDGLARLTLHADPREAKLLIDALRVEEDQLVVTFRRPTNARRL